MIRPTITGVLRLKGRDLEPSTELERLLSLSVREAEIENEHGAKFVRSCDIPSDYVIREVMCELSLVVTQ